MTTPQQRTQAALAEDARLIMYANRRARRSKTLGQIDRRRMTMCGKPYHATKGYRTLTAYERTNGAAS